MDNANGSPLTTTMPFCCGNGANISGCFEPASFLPRDVNREEETFRTRTE